MIALDIVTTVCILSLIGTEFAVSAFINPVLHRLDDAAEAQATRLFGQRLGFAMPFWYIGSFLLLIVVTMMRRHANGEMLFVAACVLWAAVIAQSLLVLVPINNQIKQLRPGGFSAEEKQQVRKWDRLHRVRVAVLTAAAVCFLVASTM